MLKPLHCSKILRKDRPVNVPSIEEDKKFYAEIQKLVKRFVSNADGLVSLAWRKSPGPGADMVREPEFKSVGRSTFSIPTPNGCWTSYMPATPNLDSYYCVTPTGDWEYVTSYHEFEANAVEIPHAWSISSRRFRKSEVRWHPLENKWKGVTVQYVFNQMKYRVEGWLQGHA